MHRMTAVAVERVNSCGPSVSVRVVKRKRQRERERKRERQRERWRDSIVYIRRKR